MRFCARSQTSLFALCAWRTKHKICINQKGKSIWANVFLIILFLYRNLFLRIVFFSLSGPHWALTIDHCQSLKALCVVCCWFYEIDATVSPGWQMLFRIIPVEMSAYLVYAELCRCWCLDPAAIGMLSIKWDQRFVCDIRLNCINCK